MYLRPRELLKPRNGRPLPVVQDASRVDEDMAVVLCQCPSSYITDLNVPFSTLRDPSCTTDYLLRLDVLLQAILICEIIEVSKDLGAAGEDRRPVWLGLK